MTVMPIVASLNIIAVTDVTAVAAAVAVAMLLRWCETSVLLRDVNISQLIVVAIQYTLS